MPVKVKYTSTIVKQCYRIARDGTKHTLFDPKSIGVAFTKVLYAKNEKLRLTYLQNGIETRIMNICLLMLRKLFMMKFLVLYSFMKVYILVNGWIWRNNYAN